MAVDPCSQLTSRMVPASTSRRNAATTAGNSSRMNATNPATTIHSWIMAPLLSSSERQHHAPVPSRIHLFDPNLVAGAHPYPRRAVGRAQRGEHLNQLTVQFHRYQSMAVTIETGH